MLELPHATAFKPQQPYRRRIAERFKDIPAPAISLIETLLSIDPVARLSAAHALNSEVLSSFAKLGSSYNILICMLSFGKIILL